MMQWNGKLWRCNLQVQDLSYKEQVKDAKN